MTARVLIVAALVIVAAPVVALVALLYAADRWEER